MFCNAFEDVPKVALRIKLVELGGANEAVDRRGALAAVVGSGKLSILA
jgi:hypothetical protein